MKIPFLSILALATAFAAPGARGQSGAGASAGSDPAAPVKLEPVRVTSDLWESPLARLPASVTVFDEASLRAGTVRHFGDLADQVPNLTWTGATSRPRHFQIRGIGENSQYEGETPDSSVRFLLDDLDFTGLGTLAGTFDTRQVEVLRGPQAGAFGANAAGGVIRVLTQAPTPFWTGLAEATVGDDGVRAGGFAVGGPLDSDRPERLMMRLAIHQHVGDGFRRNVTLNRDTNTRDEFSARLRLTFNPSPLWRWDAALLFSDLNNGFDEFALDNNGRETFSDQPGRDEQRAAAGSLRGTYGGFAGLRFTTVTNASRTNSIYSYDDDWTAASYQGFSDLRRERTVFNQELRLDSTLTRGAWGWIDRWTLGAFFSNTRETGGYTNTSPYGTVGLQTEYRADNLALFGQCSHNFNPSTRLVVGARAERIDVTGRGSSNSTVTFAPAFADTLYGGKVSLERDLGPNHLAFVSVTRGYKGGGINVDARISPPDDPLTYATEYLWTYEAGVRGHGFDQRLTGEITAFYLDRLDPQVRDSAGLGGSYRYFTANADRAHVYGLEASAAYALTKAWSLHGSCARMESTLDPFTLTNGNTGGGRPLANTPRHGYTLGTRYGAAQGFFANLELVSRARQLDSNSHDEARSPFSVVNGSLGYAWRAWTVTVWFRNLLDERYEKRVFYFGNEDPDYLETRYEDRADPRQVGLTAVFRF